jgi:Flp pilus assembly protein TadG
MRGNMSPSRGSGKERGLTFGPLRADKGDMGSSWARSNARRDAMRARERGQALVEFALVVPLFLILVLGIIQFGIGLNFWLDLNRLANQGARWAVVNCNPASTGICDPDLETAIEQDRTSGGNPVNANVCYETTPTVGQALTVHVSSQFRFRQLLNLPGITLRARATMRIEQTPTRTQLTSVLEPCP